MLKSMSHTSPTSSKMLKDSSVPRTYDPDGLRRRAACLCFKDQSEKEVLLASSTRDASKWIVPGGGIDPGEEPRVAAEREAFEEVGVIGTLGRLLGIFENTEKNTRTWVYAFYVKQLQEHWMEAKSLDRRRQWFPLADAKRVLSSHKPLQVKYLNAIDSSK